MGASREFDVILYGASGFVGRQTVAYFAAHAGKLRWALAGRSADKLEAVRAAAGAKAAGLVVADAGDAAALGALAARTRVVLSTAGPFARFGSGLVAACVGHGTHYVDITGETPWVRDLIDRHHADAARSGTRIVPCCGFDSIPSDLGAWLAARALMRDHGEQAVEVKAVFSLRGGLNGGTFASLVNALDQGEAKRMDDPFLLNPAPPPGVDPAGHADPVGARHDADFDAWLGPFFMGPVNTRVVRRSAALAGTDAPYGAGLRYQEYLRFGRGPAAAFTASGVAVGMAAAQAAMRIGAVRQLAGRLAPAPGEGPSEAVMDGGSFRCELIARGASGATARARVAGQGDPGNRATTIFVCESALALADDPGQLPGGPDRGGVLTPATALGAVLARRLAAAGMSIEPLP